MCKNFISKTLQLTKTKGGPNLERYSEIQFTSGTWSGPHLHGPNRKAIQSMCHVSSVSLLHVSSDPSVIRLPMLFAAVDPSVARRTTEHSRGQRLHHSSWKKRNERDDPTDVQLLRVHDRQWIPVIGCLIVWQACASVQILAPATARPRPQA